MNQKPLLVFDGDCGFCRRWIWRWKMMTGDKVEYAPYQEAAKRLPAIPEKRFREAVQLIEADGRHYGGAEAVLRVLAYVPGKAWLLWLYCNLPGFAWVADWSYRVVASERPLFSTLTRWLYGPDVKPSSYVFTRWIFIRLIAAVFLIAFISLWIQIDGLLGSRGILPAKEFLDTVGRPLGPARFWLFPTLYWLHPGDSMLHLLCAAGTIVSIGALAGILQGPMLLLAWAFYLSLASIGQDFLSFQWDILLLEAGFLAAFFAPWKLWDRPSAQGPPSRIFFLLLKWLLFRLMFESGCVKLLSGDPSWRSLTALTYHYETQCLPTWIAWYAHQLPAWFQKLSAVAMFVVELGAPFLIFVPRRPRMLSCGLMIGLQLLIAATGNYCFFNLLTIALCLLLIDDAAWKRLLPKRWIPAFRLREDASRSKAAGFAASALAAIVVAISCVELAGMFGVLPSWAAILVQAQDPFRTVNQYGLFAVMTTARDEVVLEGSDDGRTWREYEFKWKPGDIKQRPAFVAPHQPRLDWQMWFAALGTYRENPWVIDLMGRLLQGSPPVLALLDKNPFPDAPPRYLRAQVYEYHFTNFSQRRADGSWWRRELKGRYTPILSLRKN